MNQQEMMMEVQEMAQQAERIEQHVGFLGQQIEELEKFKSNLNRFDAKPGNKMLASFGKGVFMESELKSDKLFVEVGAGILVRKEAGEVSSILEQQIQSIITSREYFKQQFDMYTNELQNRMNTIDTEMKKNQ